VSIEIVAPELPPVQAGARPVTPLTLPGPMKHQKGRVTGIGGIFVKAMEEMLAELKAAGVAVEKVENFEYGRFAWITDPEGNRVELWEPRSE
jgi:predicted enzyme related to lactoylglutathione lyase